MNAAARTLIEGLSTIVIKQWIAWLERKQKPEGWKPTDADIQDFLDDIDLATPENVRAQARAELEAAGITIVKP